MLLLWNENNKTEKNYQLTDTKSVTYQYP